MSFEIKSGKLHVGTDVVCGENVVVDVDEEVVIGDRCVIPDNAYLCGRRIEIGNDFYGYSWENSRLDIGRGRRHEEHARCYIGDRCTFHNNRIDLARPVIVGNDVGLSPDVTIYTHGYWMSPLLGFPTGYESVQIHSRTVIGYRSVILPGACVGNEVVVGAQSVLPKGNYLDRSVYAGNPARRIRGIGERVFSQKEKEGKVLLLVADYLETRRYRNLPRPSISIVWPYLDIFGVRLILSPLGTSGVQGDENEDSDDFRDFAFKRGYRWYTNRPFKKLPGR